ncbi:MAG: sugar transferase [Epsilonproteobacteria bacterium]|nr:MAG: sugar transferase [Campylobacterota bacterium]
MKKYLFNSIIIIIDLLLLVGLFYLTLFIRISLNEFGLPMFNGLVLLDFSFVLLIVFFLMYYEGIYTFRYDFWQETQKVFKSFIVGFLMVLALLTLTKMNLEYSRIFIGVYFVLSIILMPILKRYSKKIIYSFDFFKKKAYVIGTDEQVDIFKKEFKNNWYLGQKYSKKNFDSVIISSKDLSVKKVNKLITKYLSKDVELYVVPYITDINFIHSNIMEYSNIRCNTIQIENKLLIKRSIIIKNIFDKIATILIFPLFMLIHLVVSLAIRFDSKGGVWFKQNRLGFDDKVFDVYKYRTMYEDSDELLKEYLDKNKDEIKYYDKYHKYKNDPRITTIGKLLRATSLDELPQIINVLKGDMSLVGPRPYMITESDKLGKNQHFILKVKPGITGLWQVSGRNELTFKERNELEIWYIKNWSLWADFVILVKTLKVVINKVGAK